jgi:hypothetical protein
MLISFQTSDFVALSSCDLRKSLFEMCAVGLVESL